MLSTSAELVMLEPLFEAQGGHASHLRSDHFAPLIMHQWSGGSEM
jgi:hypothetical protein